LAPQETNGERLLATGERQPSSTPQPVADPQHAAQPSACFAAQYFSKVNYIIDSVKKHGVYPPPARKLCRKQPPRGFGPFALQHAPPRQIIGNSHHTRPLFSAQAPKPPPLPASARAESKAAQSAVDESSCLLQ